MTADYFDKKSILVKEEDIQHLHDQVSYQCCDHSNQEVLHVELSISYMHFKSDLSLVAVRKSLTSRTL